MKHLLFAIFILTTSFLQAQRSDEPVDRRENDNEVKFNAGGAVFELFELSYERILNEDMGVGCSLSYFSEETVYYQGAVLPFFRFYPSEKRRAAGLFFEANSGIVFSQNDEIFFIDEGGAQTEEGENFVSFGFGVAIGGKFISKTGLFGEIYAGLGREFVDDSFIEAYPRVGLNFGYRF